MCRVLSYSSFPIKNCWTICESPPLLPLLYYIFLCLLLVSLCTHFLYISPAQFWFPYHHSKWPTHFSHLKILPTPSYTYTYTYISYTYIKSFPLPYPPHTLLPVRLISLPSVTTFSYLQTPVFLLLHK